MISSSSISSGEGAANYHAGALSEEQEGQSARGADNYYAQEAVQSSWNGHGAAVLGLEGQKVTRKDFVDILNGKIGGQQLNRETRNYTDKETGEIKPAEARAGWDFTVSAPKSISIMAIAGGDERVLAAHDKANAAAMSYIESKAQSRVSVAGEKITINTESLIYASFKHYTNRENEAQLHTHNTIANATFDKDTGKWRALKNDEIFRERANADKIYHNTLAVELTKMGHKIVVDKEGHVELAGIGKEARDALSTRTKQIEAEHAARGTDSKNASWEAKSAIKLSTRAEKVELPRDEVAKRGADIMKSLGIDLPAMIEASKGHAAEATQIYNLDAHKNADKAVASAINHLSEREAAFTKSSITNAALQFGGSKTEYSLIVKATENFIKEGRLQDAPNGLLTTADAKRDVNVMLDAIKNGVNHGAIIKSEKEFQKALKSFNNEKEAGLKASGTQKNTPFRLSTEQVNAARNILMGKAQLSGVQGSAGTGKTAALELVNRVAVANGWAVKGYAPTTAASNQLEKDTGIESITIQAAILGNADKRELEAVNQRISDVNRQIVGQLGSARAMAITTAGVGFKDKYTFSKNGDVFRTHRGLLNPISTIANAINQKSGGFLVQDKSESSKKMTIGFQSENKYTFSADGSVFKASNKFLSSNDPWAMRAIEGGRKNLAAGKTSLSEAKNFGERLAAVGKISIGNINVAVGRASVTNVQVKGLERIIAHIRTSNSVADASGPFQKISAAAKVALISITNGAAKSLTKQSKVRGLHKIAAKTMHKASLIKERKALIEELRVLKTGNNGKTLHILDEAGLAGQKDVTKLIEKIQSKDGKLVMQGDIKQHGSVTAGKAFESAQDAGMQTSLITVVQRQTKENEVGRAAVAEMTKEGGSMSAALSLLQTTEVHAKPGQTQQAHKEDQYKAVADRYMANKATLETKYADAEHRQTVGIISPRNVDREGINAAVRTELKLAGKIDKDDVIKEVFTRSDLSSEQLKVSSNYEVGQKIVAEKDIKSLDMVKGETYTIKSVDQDKNNLVIESKEGKSINLNPEKETSISTYTVSDREFSVGDKISMTANIKNGKETLVTNAQSATVKELTKDGATITTISGKDVTLTNDQMRHVDHGYARTSVKEQGATNQVQIVYMPSDAGQAVNRQMGYVAGTRAREHTEIVTDDRDKALGASDRESSKTTAVDVKAGLTQETKAKTAKETSKETSKAKVSAPEIKSATQVKPTTKYAETVDLKPPTQQDKPSNPTLNPAKNPANKLDKSNKPSARAEYQPEVKEADHGFSNDFREINQRMHQESFQIARAAGASTDELKMLNDITRDDNGQGLMTQRRTQQAAGDTIKEAKEKVSAVESNGTQQRTDAKPTAIKDEVKVESKPTNPTLDPANNPANNPERKKSLDTKSESKGNSANNDKDAGKEASKSKGKDNGIER